MWSLLGLLLAGGRLRDVVRVVTCFTVGHASTLALATFGVATPPAALIEPLIAASVVYVGVENLLDLRRGVARHRGREKIPGRRETRDAVAEPGTRRPSSAGVPEGHVEQRREESARRRQAACVAAGSGIVSRPLDRRWPIALAFGLVHGFGFAGALDGLELERTGRATALFSFNLGVELGQAAIVALAFPVLSRLRRRPAFDATGLPVGSAMVGCAGLVWLVGRIPW